MLIQCGGGEVSQLYKIEIKNLIRMCIIFVFLNNGMSLLNTRKRRQINSLNVEKMMSISHI